MVIKTRIITIIALTIVLIVGSATALVLRMQNKKMVEVAIDNTAFFGDIVEKSIDSAMREGKTQDVQRILENIGRNPEVEHIRILAPDGTILKSTQPGEIGAKSTDYIKSSFGNHPTKPFLSGDTRISYFKTVSNRHECFRCHSSADPVIGVIQVKLDISRHHAVIQSIKRILLVANLLAVLAVSAIIALLFNQFVMQPLKGLLDTIREVEAGNWKATVAEAGDDELGTISRAFNRMISEVDRLYHRNLAKEREIGRIRTDLEHKNALEELNSQLEFKIRELEAANRAISNLSKENKGKNAALERAVERLRKINDVGRVLGSIIEPEELCRMTTRTAADLLNAHGSLLHIRDGHRPSVTVRYRRGHGVENARQSAASIEHQFSELFDSGRPLLQQAGDSDSASVSRIGVPLKVKGRIIGAMLLEERLDGGSFSDDDLEFLGTLVNQATVAIENAILYDRVKDNYFSTIQSLVNALEANDRFTKGHSERVRILAIELARHIGLDFREIEILEHASILHDIGKIGIDSFIVQKQGKLTPKEYTMIKMHPVIGDAILGPITTLEGVRQTILQHHERFDGRGYPFGLRGDELLLKSRILSVVDTFDAMMSERPYRQSLSLPVIKEELRLGSGAQFDPYVVASFIEMIDKRGEELLMSAGYQTVHGTA